MKDQACKKNDEKVVGVPKDLKVAPPYHLHRGCNDQNKSKSDDDSCKASNRSEHKQEWCLGAKHRTDVNGMHLQT